MKLSLIIPCYNEAVNLPLVLERCKVFAEHSNIEVLIVNNGSTDNSERILSELLPHYPGCRSVHVQKNQGYGFGILAGLRSATGDVLAWTHADMQTDPIDVIEGLNKFDKYETNIFVKGRRHGRPLGDVVFTLGMSLFETLLLGTRLWDINAQPTMFSRQFFETWHQPPYDFSLDLYAYYQARCAKLSIHRFPVRFGKRVHGVSHWNINWAAKCKFIQRTIRFSLQLKGWLKA